MRSICLISAKIIGFFIVLNQPEIRYQKWSSGRRLSRIRNFVLVQCNKLNVAKFNTVSDLRNQCSDCLHKT